jgi:alkanesulfonate monooxygenase SsuD/methylene tetrahydromethanopterin reductase-like flavin-dependent oxidoreductase (luciferase family)
LAATAPGGFEVLSEHWRIVCEQAEEFNRPAPRRSDWRLVGPMHIAETRAEAERQAAGYIDEFASYFFRNPLGRYQKDAKDQAIADDAPALEKIRKLGIGVVGTPEDAIEQIERLLESTGGFGCYQLLAGDWANEEDTLRSLTLFAEEVAPHFTKSAQRRGEWWEYFWEARGDIGKIFFEALQNAQSRYTDERSASQS